MIDDRSVISPICSPASLTCVRRRSTGNFGSLEDGRCGEYSRVVIKSFRKTSSHRRSPPRCIHVLKEKQEKGESSCRRKQTDSLLLSPFSCRSRRFARSVTVAVQRMVVAKNILA